MRFMLRRGVFGFGIMAGWSRYPDDGACRTHTPPQDFALSPRSVGYSAIRKCASWHGDRGQKNDSWSWSSAKRLILPLAAARARSVELSVSDLPAARHSPHPLPSLRQREPRGPRLADAAGRRRSRTWPLTCMLPKH